MPDPRILVTYHLATAEQYDGFEFAPKIIQVPHCSAPYLSLNVPSGVCMFMSISQLEILKATIGAFLEAEAEKNKAVASALIDEAAQEATNVL